MKLNLTNELIICYDISPSKEESRKETSTRMRDYLGRNVKVVLYGRLLSYRRRPSDRGRVMVVFRHQSTRVRRSGKLARRLSVCCEVSDHVVYCAT